jgi:hypothetical protein
LFRDSDLHWTFSSFACTLIGRSLFMLVVVSSNPSDGPVDVGSRFVGGDGLHSCASTPVVCSATRSLLALLALVVVEAGTSCRSSVIAL